MAFKKQNEGLDYASILFVMCRMCSFDFSFNAQDMYLPKRLSRILRLFFFTFGTKTRHNTVVLAKRMALLKMMKRRSTRYMNTVIVGTATAIVTATVYTEKAMYLPMWIKRKLCQ